LYVLVMGQPTEDAKREALAYLAEVDAEDARNYARKAEAFVAVADLFTGRDDPAAPYMTLDVALELQIAPATATARIRESRHLVHDLPRTLAGLKVGELTIGQGIVLVKETAHLTPEMSRQVEALVIPAVLGLTAGDTTREVKRVIAKLDHLAAEKRRQEEKAKRRVWNSPRPDGRALIGGELSAEDAGIFMKQLDDLAKATFTDADDRTDDQQRADLFRHLPGFALAHADGHAPGWFDYLAARGEQNLTGCPVPARRRAKTQAVVLIPVETALDLAEEAAELLGYGPISGAHARELLADADLRKACTDARTGRIFHLDPPHQTGPTASRERAADPVDTIHDMVLTPSWFDPTPEPHYRPSDALAELVRLRDLRCTGPGCACPAHRADLDHITPYPHGQTEAENLGPASRGCHNAKTHGGWQVQRHPDGSTTWTSPLGRTWHRPARAHPPNLDAIRRPRLIWPQQLIETEGWQQHAA
jgi:hypothetical protein